MRKVLINDGTMINCILSKLSALFFFSIYLECIHACEHVDTCMLDGSIQVLVFSVTI